MILQRIVQNQFLQMIYHELKSNFLLINKNIQDPSSEYLSKSSSVALNSIEDGRQFDQQFIYNSITSIMKRTTQHHTASHSAFRTNCKDNFELRSSKDSDLTVRISLSGTKHMTLKVPLHCNMKILKSMIHFNLKKLMPHGQCNHIIGLQTEDDNYELDYLLQNGLGVLQNNLYLKCLEKTDPKSKNSILNYKICKLISVGGFSKVFLLRDRTNGQFRAGKFIVKDKLNQRLVLNQFQLSCNIVHPFILQTHDLIETQHFYVFILEFYTGGELFQLLKKNRFMKEEKAKFYVVEALLALKHLHERFIVFRDIKPQNILIDTQGHLRLVDFGLAKRISHKTYSFCGSLDYMAPQMLRDEGHSFEADYYAIGNLMFEILVGSPPFYHPKFCPEQTKFHILNSDVRFPEYMKLSKSAIDLMKRLLTKDPTERLGFQGGIDSILAHEWFNEINIQDYLNKLVEPPFPVQSKISFMIEQNTQQKQLWQALLQKDIKQETLKESIKSAQMLKGNRRRSLNTQKSCDEKEGHSEAKRSEEKPNSKLRITMDLLSVLTHKRTSSECQSTTNQAQAKKTSNLFTLKPINMSRKSSLLQKSHKMLKSGIDSPSRGGKDEGRCTPLIGEEKETIIKKRRKQNQPFVRSKIRQ